MVTALNNFFLKKKRKKRLGYDLTMVAGYRRGWATKPWSQLGHGQRPQLGDPVYPATTMARFPSHGHVGLPSCRWEGTHHGAATAGLCLASTTFFFYRSITLFSKPLFTCFLITEHVFWKHSYMGVPEFILVDTLNLEILVDNRPMLVTWYLQTYTEL
jgi:hypothetical protein